jgi:hypothetical protein
MKMFVIIFHVMVYEPSVDMYKGFTFFDPEIPKYKTIKECITKGTIKIQEAMDALRLYDLDVKDGRFDCIEVNVKGI